MVYKGKGCISAIFDGSIPIALVKHGLDTVFQKNTGDNTNYVANGLIAHFSGEDDYKDGSWVDRVSGYKFTPSSNAPVYDAENKLYEQTQAGIVLGDFKIPGDANYTFEAVFRDIKNSTNPTHNDYNAIVGGDMNDWEVATSCIAMGKNHTNNAIWCALYGVSRINIANDEFEDNELTTFTIVPTVGIFRDGVKILDCGTPTAERSISLFGHASGPYTHYTRSTGKIHSVRMYNRQLTAEEVAQNHAEDIRIYGE